MLNINIIYNNLKTLNNIQLLNDKIIFDIINNIVFKRIKYNQIIKLKQINKGQSKDIYVTNNYTYVYKIKKYVTKIWKLLEELYLLNNIFQNDFQLDIISIEKIDNQYIFCYSQKFCTIYNYKTKLDFLTIKLKIVQYMKNLGYYSDINNSDNSLIFNLSFKNNKYQIFDLTPWNVTLNNNKLFFYDINLEFLKK